MYWIKYDFTRLYFGKAENILELIIGFGCFNLKSITYIYGDELGFDGDTRCLRLHSVFSASTIKKLKSQFKRQL